LSRTAVSPPAAASLVWRSTHQPQPLIWLARRPTSSCVDFGSGACKIARLALANRLLNLAPISLPNMLNRGSMTSSSLVGRAAELDEHETPAARRFVTAVLVSQNDGSRCLVGKGLESAKEPAHGRHVADRAERSR